MPANGPPADDQVRCDALAAQYCLGHHGADGQTEIHRGVLPIAPVPLSADKVSGHILTARHPPPGAPVSGAVDLPVRLSGGRWVAACAMNAVYQHRFGEVRVTYGVGMGSPITSLYARVAQDFTDRLLGCPQDRWNSVSPCPGWTAWDVAAHVVGNHRRACAGLSGHDYRVPTAGEDVVAAWLEATAEVQAALESEATAQQVLGAEFGNLPFERFVRRMACADTLIHTWDFARATGQDEHLDPEAVELARTFLVAEDDRIRLPHAFGAKVAPTDNADTQTQLLNFLGRAT